MEAEYGGVDALRRFMIRFPLLLGLGLGIAFAVITLLVLAGLYVSGVDFASVSPVFWLAPRLVFATSLLSVAPWIVLAPWIRRRLEQKTAAALDTFLINVRHAAQVDA